MPRYRFWERWHEKPHNDPTFMREQRQVEHPLRARIRELVESPVLEVGCATGLDAGEGWVGVDISMNYLRYGRGYHDGATVNASGESLPFRDKAFNSTYMKDLLEHLPQGMVSKVVREMARVARRLLAVAWITPLTDEPTLIRRTRYGFFRNRYNYGEMKRLFQKFGALEGDRHLFIVYFSSIYIAPRTQASPPFPG